MAIEKKITVAPYGTMRVIYEHFNLGKKGRMQYLDPDTKLWNTVGYYDDYADLMTAYHNEVANHHD